MSDTIGNSEGWDVCINSTSPKILEFTCNDPLELRHSGKLVEKTGSDTRAIRYSTDSA